MKKLLIFFITLFSFPIYADDCDSFGVHTYQYEYKPSNPGDLITIGDDNYRIVKVPFVEFKTGKSFYIQYPIIESVSNPKHLLVSLSTSHILNKPDDCLVLSIGGLKTNVIINTLESRTLSYIVFGERNNKEGVSIYAGSKRESVSKYIFINLSIYIEETMLSLSLSKKDIEKGSILETTAINHFDSEVDYDLTDNYDLTTLTDESLLHGELDELFDYVTIGEL